MKMKLLARTLSLLVIASLTLFFANCGGGGGETDPKKVALGKLSKTWELGTATIGGNPSTQIESTFTITFSGTFDSASPNGPYDYVVTGTLEPSPWPASDEWIFSATSGNEGQIIRDSDGAGIVYSIGSDGKLTLTFTCDGCNFSGARTSSVDGQWVFILDPQ